MQFLLSYENFDYTGDRPYDLRCVIMINKDNKDILKGTQS